MEKRLLQAAEAGDPRSQYNLGILYDNGLDDNGYAVIGNRRQAVRWLLSAAEQGFPRAQLKLAEIYAANPEFSETSVEACTWFLLAKKGLRGAQLQGAQSAYQRASLRLTPAQLANAISCAERWQPKRPTDFMGGRT